MYWSSCVRTCVFTHMCWCVLWQDMGQDVETYYQEVLATLEQSAEEGCRGERGALRSRFQQLYTEIVNDTDSGRSSMKRKSALQSHAWLCLSVVELLTMSHQLRKLSWTWVKGEKTTRTTVASRYLKTKFKGNTKQNRKRPDDLLWRHIYELHRPCNLLLNWLCLWELFGLLKHEIEMKCNVQHTNLITQLVLSTVSLHFLEFCYC